MGVLPGTRVLVMQKLQQNRYTSTRRNTQNKTRKTRYTTVFYMNTNTKTEKKSCTFFILYYFILQPTFLLFSFVFVAQKGLFLICISVYEYDFALLVYVLVSVLVYHNYFGLEPLISPTDFSWPPLN